MNVDAAAKKLVEECIRAAKCMKEDICRVCYNDIEDGSFKLACGHVFHLNCVLRIIEGRCAHVCARCATEISEKDKKTIIAQKGDNNKAKRKQELRILQSLKKKKLAPLLNELIAEP